MFAEERDGESCSVLANGYDDGRRASKEEAIKMRAAAFRGKKLGGLGYFADQLVVRKQQILRD